jgi:hypothetical protein
LRQDANTLHPSFFRVCAASRPMPELQPVMRMVLCVPIVVVGNDADVQGKVRHLVCQI